MNYSSNIFDLNSSKTSNNEDLNISIDVLSLLPNHGTPETISATEHFSDLQNSHLQYENEDRITLCNNNNCFYDDSANSAFNQLFANPTIKRPIIGGHNMTPQTSPHSKYIQSHNLPWNCYGSSTNTANTITSGSVISSVVKLTNNTQQLNNPWNQALFNQKMGLAPEPVNTMNLSIYPQNIVIKNNCSPSNSCNGKKQSQRCYVPSPQNINNNSSTNSNGNCINKSKSNFDPTSSNQSIDLSQVDGSIYDSVLSNNINYVDKFSSSDTLKINFETQFLDVLRSFECKTSAMSLEDSSEIISNENYKNTIFKNVNPFVFPLPQREESFSRKVFVGGLPPDIDEEEITAAFKRFGILIVDWPHKVESKSYFPPKGYCFLLFQDEISVQDLIDACIMDENKFYWCVSSPTIKDKPVQIRPWSLADSDFVMDGSEPLDPRKTIFVGGVPRPLRAVELAMIMDRLYGGVCYSGIDTDPELKYPKGAGRVAFSNQRSYIAAISARFVQLQHHDIDKRVEVKPYVLDDQMCDECQGSRCSGKFAPFFCANVSCLQYYCEQCWAQIHSRQGREYHKPLVKEGADRPRTVPFRW